MKNQIDLDTLELGGTPSLWVFVDEWNSEKSVHKDGDMYVFNGAAIHRTDEGKEFPIVELTKIYLTGINEDFKLSAWAIKTEQKFKVPEMAGKTVFFKKNGTRLLMSVATPFEVENWKAQQVKEIQKQL